MVTFSNVGVEFGPQELFRDVSIVLGPSDRIGLVGPNGSGKSTILRMISRELEPSFGAVQIRKGMRIAYLPQTGVKMAHRTVLQEAVSAFSQLEADHNLMLKCEQEMARSGLNQRKLDVLLERYAEFQQRYETEGYTCKARAEKVLLKLGFKQVDFDAQLQSRSGGFRVRLALARMLLQKPDLLLLDEPTNYLDIRSIEWLQQYLAGFHGAFVIVAHDRYLLDGIVRKIWAIENRNVRAFVGNYSGYLRDKQVRDEQQKKKYGEQQAFIRRTKAFIAKFKGRKDTAKRAMSRQRMLDKLELIEQPRIETAIRIRFPEADEIYGRAFELCGVAKEFNGKQVFSGVNIAVKGGEKVGLFGANGSGKTTLLRIVARQLKPTQGQVWWSRKTEVAYYEQGAEERLDPSLTVLESLRSVAQGYTENELKGILGIFLFSGDDSEKKVGVLSGGERSRLAIIRVLLMPSNLLVLDEPTNHLDIQSRRVLFKAMSRYKRAVVFAAHDRFMLDRLAEKVVRVEAGKAVLFPGNYSYASSQPEKAQERRRENPKKIKKKVMKPVPIVRLKERLAQVRQDYQAARERFDLSRAWELTQEERDIQAEIERAEVKQVEGEADKVR
ncbi:hypothetical protein CH330_09275 [candidate division WOR-3 bacterium JGI_Cruoil_03_51_56]|uniref:ABC transporter domain-containing protein n=1 Tax=candidate division WOR-3 bacterium JGI_Cruoil_03_51_56 TaxID=1973747 RepID=A0A235BQ52_UNCW3|nr:MAG: hypothetical protein CH330_09275 [candidate division WOR-3 bacterium JGI_Cruoil_03_51_56]